MSLAVKAVGENPQATPEVPAFDAEAAAPLCTPDKPWSAWSSTTWLEGLHVSITLYPAIVLAKAMLGLVGGEQPGK